MECTVRIGTISENVQYGLIDICAKSHACITIRAIFAPVAQTITLIINKTLACAEGLSTAHLVDHPSCGGYKVMTSG